MKKGSGKNGDHINGREEYMLQSIEALNTAIRVLQDFVIKTLEKTLRKERIKNEHRQNNHHITPRSRGGKSTKENLARVDIYLHVLYHQLFGNKTPIEILKWLNKYFWNSNYKITIKKKKKKITPKKTKKKSSSKKQKGKKNKKIT